MPLLPSSRPDIEGRQEGDLRLLSFDDDPSDTVLDAIASQTARRLLRSIHEEPATPAELADRGDMSIQNVTYHLEKLEAAELV